MHHSPSVEDVYLRAGLTSPWPSVKNLPFDPHHWFSTAPQLLRIFESRLAMGHPIETVIEVGCWLGASTRWFAERAKLVIAIDTFKGSPEHHREGRKETLDRIPTLYEQFLSNCRKFSDRIAPIRMDSAEALKLHLPTADLAFIDAEHSAEAVERDTLMS